MEGAWRRHVGACVGYGVYVYIWRSEDNLVRVPFFPSTFKLVPGIELRSQDFHSKSFSNWAILSALFEVLNNFFSKHSNISLCFPCLTLCKKTKTHRIIW